MKLDLDTTKKRRKALSRVRRLGYLPAGTSIRRGDWIVRSLTSGRRHLVKTVNDSVTGITVIMACGIEFRIDQVRRYVSGQATHTACRNCRRFADER